MQEKSQEKASPATRAGKHPQDRAIVCPTTTLKVSPPRVHIHNDNTTPVHSRSQHVSPVCVHSLNKLERGWLADNSQNSRKYEPPTARETRADLTSPGATVQQYCLRAQKLRSRRIATTADSGSATYTRLHNHQEEVTLSQLPGYLPCLGVGRGGGGAGVQTTPPPTKHATKTTRLESTTRHESQKITQSPLSPRQNL